MGWTYMIELRGEEERHEGFLLPRFADGRLGQPSGGTGTPPGHIPVERRDDGFWLTYPAGAVTGWQITCTCMRSAALPFPLEQWVSDQLWTRVPSPVQHDPNSFRIYAADTDVEDVGRADDVEPVARALWRREHIDERDAVAAIRAATRAIRSAEAQLTEAVLAARQRPLSWAKIGAAAGMSAQAAHERWAKRDAASG